MKTAVVTPPFFLTIRENTYTLEQRDSEVAELADAPASGAGSRKGVEVRVLSSALNRARGYGNDVPLPFLASLHFSAKFPPKGTLQGVSIQQETHMAGIRKKGDGYHCTFRFQGKRY